MARRPRVGLWATVLMLALWAQTGAAQGLPGLPMERCERLTLAADDATCTPTGCALLGNAVITCGALVLRADGLTVHMDRGGQFAGAQALGHVLFDDGSKVMQSHAITLGADRISASVCRGLLQVRRPQIPGPRWDEHGAPQGPFALTLTGDIERQASGHVTAWDGTVTLCDCGPDRPPSWQLFAPRVEVDPGIRATVWWPQLKVNMLGLKLLPITPPLLPVSLPLTPRAFGLLVPQITFLGPPWPTVDVPLFVPLGPSWDITLSPGSRGDWAFAPRFGLRLRGAPSPRQQLALEWRTTWDVGRRAAARFAALAVRGGWANGAAYQAQLAQRQQLLWRSRLEVSHHWALLAPAPLRPGHKATFAADWRSAVNWISDDAVLMDLGVSSQERVATYLPSRTVLTARHPRAVLEVGADAMVRLDSVAVGADGTATPVLRNWSATELETLHRLPYGQALWLGAPWSGALHPSLRLSAVRYGAVAARPKDRLPGYAHSQAGARAEAGLSWARPLGALRSRLGANLDAVAFATQGSQTLVDGVLVLDGELALPLWRPVGGQLHMVVPSLQYRALARPSPRHLALFVAGTDALDPYLERGAVHQLVLTVRQTLGPEGRGAALDLSQPIDLRGRALGQPSARLTVRWGALVQLGTLVSLNLHAGGPRLQHVSQQLAVGHRRVSVWAHYLRAAPGADRFIRTVYELSAAKDTRADVGGAAWAHSLMAGGQMAVGAGFSARYAVTFALPKPEASVGAQPLWQSAAAQNIEVAYRSPCECWGISTTLSASPQNFGPTWRMQVLLTVADTRVGI